MLVEPILTEDASHTFSLPSGVWREFALVGENTDETPELPVLKIRGGSIVPLGRVVQSTTEPLLEPLTLLVSLDDGGEARGVHYEDAGEGYGYQEGDYLLTTYAAELVGDNVEVRVSMEEGDRSRPARTIEVVVVTDSGVVSGSGTDGQTITVPLP